MKLQRELHLPGVASVFDATEIRSIRDTAVRVQKLRMVEYVKKLSAELEVRSLAQGSEFLHGEVEVGDSWSAANSPRRIAQQLQWGRIGILDRERKRIGVEIEATVGSRIEGAEWGNQIRFTRQLEVKTVFQFRVVAGLQSNGETCLEGSDARNLPSIHDLPLHTIVFGNRKRPKVADHEAVPCVEEGERAITAVANGL